MEFLPCSEIKCRKPNDEETGNPGFSYKLLEVRGESGKAVFNKTS